MRTRCGSTPAQLPGRLTLRKRHPHEVATFRLVKRSIGEFRAQGVAEGITPGSEEFQTGLEACGSILQNAGFGGGRGNLAEDPAVQDGLVEYSQCLRDEGLAVGDIQLGGGGGQGAAPPQDGQGQGGRGGGIDREARIAAFLGIDPDDPEVAAALETCGLILDQLFAQVGRDAG